MRRLNGNQIRGRSIFQMNSFIMTFFIDAELRQAFNLFDTDRSGGISVRELRQALSVLGVKLNEQQARDMFRAIDTDSKTKTRQSQSLFSLF